MSFHPLFTIEVGFYFFTLLTVMGVIGVIMGVYLSLYFHVAKTSHVYCQIIAGKYYIDNDRLYFDRQSIFDTSRIKKEKERKLNRYVINNKSIKCKKIFGFGYYINMSNLKLGSFSFLLVMLSLAIFTYNSANYYFDYNGIVLPEINDIFTSEVSN
jgi:hypothetical protein